MTFGFQWKRGAIYEIEYFMVEISGTFLTKHVGHLATGYPVDCALGL
jgi:hypothetical protein